MKKEIFIVGAGLSGLIAAINLAKDDYDVTVIEAEPKIGGSPAYHPSLHITPINKKKVWDYIGLDLEDCFVTLDSLPSYIYGRKKDLYPDFNFGVERGSRPSSIDSILYNEAINAGVKFQFNTRINSIDDLPPQTIIATGLYPAMYDALGLPYKEITCAHVYKEPSEKDKYALAIFSKNASEYFYGGAFNNILYCLLPMTTPPNMNDLKVIIKELDIYEKINIPEKEWRFISLRVPTGGPDNLKLFYKDKILAGSVSGMMDPFLLFGIHGAMISGKIAAIAVKDKSKAMEEFQKANKNFIRTYRIKKYYEMIPANMKMASMSIMSRTPRLFGPLIKIMCSGIPGHDEDDFLLRSQVGPGKN